MQKKPEQKEIIYNQQEIHVEQSHKRIVLKEREPADDGIRWWLDEEDHHLDRYYNTKTARAGHSTNSVKSLPGVCALGIVIVTRRHEKK